MLVQIAIPASYYLVRDDPDDERFAWRMFSAIRLKRCDVQADELRGEGARRAIRLEHALHASWQRSLARGRRPVVERFLASRCAHDEVSEVHLTRQCTSPSGSTLPTQYYRFVCGSKTLEVVR